MSDAPKIVPELLPLVYWPDPKLNQKCTNVEVFDEKLEQFVANMFATMKYHLGVGLAAPQVGRQENIITLWIERESPLIFINPSLTIIEESEPFEFEEGCLSVPGHFEKRKRPDRVVVNFQNVVGEDVEVELRDLNAFAFQHEYDHLQGETFVDGLSSLKKSFLKRKVTKNIKRQNHVKAIADRSAPFPADSITSGE